jgi:hypothetical protein
LQTIVQLEQSNDMHANEDSDALSHVISLQSQSLEEPNNQLQENMDNILEESTANKSENQ